LVALTMAHSAAAQEPPWDDASVVVEDADEESMIVTDGGDDAAIEYGTPAEDMFSPGMDQGMPYVMQREGEPFQPQSYGAPADLPPRTYSPWLTRLGFRHSYTHGRNVGWGRPLVGTSWLNRPFYYGATLGPMWMTRRLADSVGRDVDLIGSVFIGCDWDYYWGSEFQYAYATPELINSADPDAPHENRMVHWNYSLMYYPWGDSTIRPYWRLGVGDSKFDFPTDSGSRHDEWLFTFPVGVGVKYPVRRWLAARGEFTDLISWGDNGVASQHNLTLTFGLECRFGARRKSFWPWNPSNHIW
jgi:hypothetical protein